MSTASQLAIVNNRYSEQAQGVQYNGKPLNCDLIAVGVTVPLFRTTTLIWTRALQNNPHIDISTLLLT